MRGSTSWHANSARCFSPTGCVATRKPGAFSNPPGRFLSTVWARIGETEFALVATGARAAVFPADPPRFLARTPHGYADVARIRDDLAAAGFDAISIETLATTSKGSSPRDVAV